MVARGGGWGVGESGEVGQNKQKPRRLIYNKAAYFPHRAKYFSVFGFDDFPSI